MTIPTDGRIDLDALAELAQRLRDANGWLAALDYPGVGTAMATCEDGANALDNFIDLSRRAAIPSEQGEAVAWVFELARARQQQTGEWMHFGPPQLSFTKPNVPDGSIRNLHALGYAHPAPAAGVKVKAREAAEAEIARWGDDADPASVARSAVAAALKALDQGEPK